MDRVSPTALAKPTLLGCFHLPAAGAWPELRIFPALVLLHATTRTCLLQLRQFPCPHMPLLPEVSCQPRVMLQTRPVTPVRTAPSMFLAHAFFLCIWTVFQLWNTLSSNCIACVAIHGSPITHQTVMVVMCTLERSVILMLTSLHAHKSNLQDLWALVRRRH
jgi:hypothetical protein